MNDLTPTEAWQWVSVTQASEILKLSPATIRRRIRDGETIVSHERAFQLVAEREQRPQGTQFLVRLPAGLRPPAGHWTPADGTEDASEDAPAATLTPDSHLTISSALAAAVAPWVAQSARLQHQVLEQAEHAGELRAKLEVERARADALALERDAYRRDLGRLETSFRACQDEYTGVLMARGELHAAALEKLAVVEAQLRELELEQPAERRPTAGWGWWRWLGVMSPW